jgi:hypothetical protein
MLVGGAGSGAARTSHKNHLTRTGKRYGQIFDKESKMRGTSFFRVLGILVLIAIIAGGSIYVYNMGLVQGRAEGAQLSGQEPGGMVYPPYGYWPVFRPFGFGFGFFGLLFLLIPIFFLSRLLFWWPRGGWGGHHTGEGRDVPRRFEEWHQRLHDQGQAEP